MKKKTVKDVELAGKRILMRVDYNVPMDKNQSITDYTRIEASLPTINYILGKSPKYLVLMSHLGRPKGQVKPELSLRPVAKGLADKLGKDVLFAEDCVGEKAESVINSAPDGAVILLENVRFHPEEEKDDENFARELAKFGDVYVGDAFGSVHRAHASVHAVPKVMKEEGKNAVAGFLIEKELEYLGNAINNPERPFVAILGGAKISSKIGVIESLLKKVDKLIIGGGMAYTFFKAMGYEIGKSLLEEDKVELAKKLLDEAGDKIVLPVDVVVADEIKEGANSKVVRANEIPSDMMGVDIGPDTVSKFKDILKDAKTVFWNGPLGVFEIDEFAKGTFEVAKLLADIDATTVIGGGDSAAAVKKAGLADKMTHISTGGGASLEFVEGKPLPGIEILEDA